MLQVQRAVEAAVHAGKEAERKSLTALQRIEGARREGESARLALEQARQHCKMSKQKAKAAAQKPLRRKGMRRGLRYYSDGSDRDSSVDSDSRSRINSSSSGAEDELQEVPELKKKSHDNLSRITEQNSFDHSDYHSAAEEDVATEIDGGELTNVMMSGKELLVEPPLKLPAIDESSECGSTRSFASSFVYRSVEKSICGAAKTPVLISPLARNIVQLELRECKLSRSGTATPLPGSAASSNVSSTVSRPTSRPLYSKSHSALLTRTDSIDKTTLNRMDSVDI